MFAGLVIALDVILVLFWVIFLGIVMSNADKLEVTAKMFKLLIAGTAVIIVLNILADKI